MSDTNPAADFPPTIADRFRTLFAGDTSSAVPPAEPSSTSTSSAAALQAPVPVPEPSGSSVVEDQALVDVAALAAELPAGLAEVLDAAPATDLVALYDAIDGPPAVWADDVADDGVTPLWIGPGVDHWTRPEPATKAWVDVDDTGARP